MTRLTRRRALAAAGGLATALAGCSGRADTPPVPPTLPADGGVERGVTYRDGEVTLRADVYHPGGEVAVVLHAGGGWAAGDSEGRSPSGSRTQSGDTERLALFDRILDADVAVVDVDYRRGTGAFPGAVRDLVAAAKWVRANAPSLRVDPTRLAVVGEGAGGHLGALVAAASARPAFQPRDYYPEVAAVVGGVASLSGLYDLPALCETGVPDAVAAFTGGDCGSERYRNASPVTHVDGLDPPVWLAHGTDDARVPVQQATRYRDALREGGVEASLFRAEGGGHGFWRREEWRERVGDGVVAFLGETVEAGGV